MLDMPNSMLPATVVNQPPFRTGWCRSVFAPGWDGQNNAKVAQVIMSPEKAISMVTSSDCPHELPIMSTNTTVFFPSECDKALVAIIVHNSVPAHYAGSSACCYSARGQIVSVELSMLWAVTKCGGQWVTGTWPHVIKAFGHFCLRIRKRILSATTMAAHAACDGKVADVLARHRAGRNFANVPIHRGPIAAEYNKHVLSWKEASEIVGPTQGGQATGAPQDGRHKRPPEAIDTMAAYLDTVPPKKFWHTHKPVLNTLGLAWWVGVLHDGSGFCFFFVLCFDTCFECKPLWIRARRSNEISRFLWLAKTGCLESKIATSNHRRGCRLDRWSPLEDLSKKAFL